MCTCALVLNIYPSNINKYCSTTVFAQLLISTSGKRILFDMGRRSINTTKGGNYMHPTDQARKEARKKELKKFKKQRQMVRDAVLKKKNPSQILEEMEKIDDMEYNVLQPSPLNEKVLRDKRKKLRETFDRVMRLYHNDNPEQWSELKRKEVEYEKKRLKKQQFYKSVKHAQSVQLDEIPLPASTRTSATTTSTETATTNRAPKRLPPPPASLSLPPFAPGVPPGVLKKINDNLSKHAEKPEKLKKKETLGVPVGPPPDLRDFSDLDTDAEDDEVVLRKYVPKSKSKVVAKPNSLQQRMVAISGQNIDDFMKEMENVHKKKVAAGRLSESKTNAGESDEKKIQSDGEGDDDQSETSLSSENSDEDDSDATIKHKRNDSETFDKTAVAATTLPLHTAAVAAPVAPLPMPISLPNMPAQPPHIHVTGPPVPPMGGMAPPPMMFRPPPRPPGMHAFGIRMPPGPPPGPRPGMLRMGIRIPGPPLGILAHHKNQQQQKQDSKGVTTITAKPQIRNLSADVTRFVPSALRIKRDDTRKPNRTKPFTQEITGHPSKESNNAASKDDAYTQFMNEMQGLL